MLDSKLNNNHLFEQPLYVKVSRDPLLLWVETDNRKIAASSFLPGTFQHNATVTNNRKKKTSNCSALFCEDTCHNFTEDFKFHAGGSNSRNA